MTHTDPPASSASEPDRADGRSTPPPNRSAFSRWFKRGFRVLLVLLCVMTGAYFYLTRPSALEQRVEAFLEASIGCEADVGRCTLTWDGVLTVDGVELYVPGETGEAARVLHADQVILGIRLAPIFLGKVRASTLAIDSPTLYLTEDLSDGQFNYQKLIALPSAQGRTDLPDVLPEIYLQGGSVRFGRVRGGVYEQTEAVSLVGTLTSDRDQRGVYRFYLNQHDELETKGRGSGPSIHGRINLDEPMVELRVDRFEFKGPHRYLLPSAMRNWWDRLSPQGALPRVVFSAAMDEDNQAVLTAQVELDGIGLMLPIPGGEPFEMTDVAGRVSLARRVVKLTEITGKIEGIDFEAQGRVEGFESDAPFRVAFSTDPFVVPAEGGIWDKLPPSISKFQTRFAPQGLYQTKVTIEKPDADAELVFNGHLDLLDTRFRYYRFPYEAKSLTGRITFSQEQTRLNDLIGIAPSGGRAVVSGTITPPGGHGAVDITITGKDMPLDEHLTAAMEPKHRRVIDMFFDQGSYEELLSKGVIRASAQADHADTPPHLELGGNAKQVKVHIQRPAGEGKKYRVTTDIQVDGLTSLFKFWQYPLVATGGSVRVGPGFVEVKGVVFQGLNGGGGVVEGTLDLPNDEHGLVPSLQLKGIRLPVDELLIASIPEPQDAWVQSLALTGDLIGTGEIFADGQGEVDFTVDGRLVRGSATPNGGDYVLSEVNGLVTVERTRVQLEDLSAKHERGVITINGQTDWGEHGVGVELDFHADSLRIEPGLIYLLPPEHEALPRLTELFETYRPDGLVDGDLEYVGRGDGSDRFSLTVDPQVFSFDYKGQRVDLVDLTGQARLEPDSAKLEKIAGRFPAGTFGLDGVVAFHNGLDIDLSFDVYASQIDPTARAFLPTAARSVVDRLSLQGPYQVTDATLLTQHGDDGQQGILFQGRVGFQGAEAQVGVPVQDMYATADIYLVKPADQDWPQTQITINADRLLAADRQVRRCSFRFETGAYPWLIQMKDLKGSIYGGALIGDGELRLGEAGAYSFDITIQEAALEPFLYPQTSDAETDSVGLPMRDMGSGLLSASLSIRAPLDDPTQKQGRGVVLVRDAKLYDRPLTMALLQAANFALPNESSFDRASGRYLIYGDTVRFDDIRFEAPGFVIAGSGVMDFPSTELKLRMVTHNPTAPNLGAVTSLVRTFKDELLGIEVTGKLAEPTARVVPLAGIFSSWGRVFGENQARYSDVPISE